MVDHEMYCSPLLASSHRLRSDISCCYFGMPCCQAVVASHLSVAEVKWKEIPLATVFFFLQVMLKEQMLSSTAFRSTCAQSALPYLLPA